MVLWSSSGRRVLTVVIPAAMLGDCRAPMPDVNAPGENASASVPASTSLLRATEARADRSGTEEGEKGGSRKETSLKTRGKKRKRRRTRARTHARIKRKERKSDADAVHTPFLTEGRALACNGRFFARKNPRESHDPPVRISRKNQRTEARALAITALCANAGRGHANERETANARDPARSARKSALLVRGDKWKRVFNVAAMVKVVAATFVQGEASLCCSALSVCAAVPSVLSLPRACAERVRARSGACLHARAHARGAADGWMGVRAVKKEGWMDGMGGCGWRKRSILACACACTRPFSLSLLRPFPVSPSRPNAR